MLHLQNLILRCSKDGAKFEFIYFHLFHRSAHPYFISKGFKRHMLNWDAAQVDKPLRAFRPTSRTPSWMLALFKRKRFGIVEVYGNKTHTFHLYVEKPNGD